MSADEKNKPTKHAITDDVYLYTTRLPGPPLSFLYEVECCRFNVVRFSMDFTGSSNFALEGRTDGLLTVDMSAPPFTRTKVARIVLEEQGKGASLKNTYSWGMDEPDEDAVNAVLEVDRSNIEGERNRAKKLGFGNDSATVEDIQKRCKANKVSVCVCFC